jgi:predicted nucleotidyltransferase
LLNEKNVEYLIVGGHAVGLHGHPRTTGDLDIWVAVDTANAQRVIDAIRAFGFDDPTLTVAELQKPGRIIRMGHPPVRIEVMTSASGVDFRDCYDRRGNHDMDGIAVDIIGLDDLLRNKRAAGRPKDLGDLDALE